MKNAAGSEKMKTCGPRCPKRAWLWRVCFGAYTALLFALTHIPIPDLGPAPFVWFDKVEHVVAYGVWTALLLAAWPAGMRMWWAVAALGLVWGGLDEWTQQFVGRSAELWDWAADGVGVGVGLGVSLGVWRLVKRGQ